MKVRSSQVVLAIIILVGCVVTAAVLRSQGSKKSESTDDFLKEVEQLRDAGQGSKESAGIVRSREVDMANRPKIELTIQDLEMGLIPNNQKSTKRTPVKNTGTVPLEISEVRSSCVCTAGVFEEQIARADGKKITVIPPGQERDLIVSVDPALVHGFFADRTLTLHSNDPVTPQYSIIVKSKIEPEFTMVPDRLDFGIVPRGSEQEARAIIRQLQEAPMEITGVQIAEETDAKPRNEKSMAQFITMELQKRPADQWQSPSKAEWEIVAKLAPETPIGNIYQVFSVQSNVARVPTIDSVMEGLITSFYLVDPLNISVRNPVAPGQKDVAFVTVTSQIPIEISQATITGSDLEVSVKPGDVPGKKEIYLSVKPEATAGLKTEYISFQITGAGKTLVHKMRALASVATETPVAQ